MQKITEILKAAVNAFNQIPNKKINDPNYKDTYQIASAIDKAIEREQHRETVCILCYTIKTEKQTHTGGTLESFTDHFEVFIEPGEYEETPEQLARQKLDELRQTETDNSEIYTWNICRIISTSEAYC